MTFIIIIDLITIIDNYNLFLIKQKENNYKMFHVIV